MNNSLPVTGTDGSSAIVLMSPSDVSEMSARVSSLAMSSSTKTETNTELKMESIDRDSVVVAESPTVPTAQCEPLRQSVVAAGCVVSLTQLSASADPCCANLNSGEVNAGHLAKEPSTDDRSASAAELLQTPTAAVGASVQLGRRRFSTRSAGSSADAGGHVVNKEGKTPGSKKPKEQVNSEKASEFVDDSVETMTVSETSDADEEDVGVVHDVEKIAKPQATGTDSDCPDDSDDASSGSGLSDVDSSGEQRTSTPPQRPSLRSPVKKAPTKVDPVRKTALAPSSSSSSSASVGKRSDAAVYNASLMSLLEATNVGEADGGISGHIIGSHSEKLIEHMATLYRGNTDVFFDMGSGMGGPTVTAALTQEKPFRAAFGADSGPNQVLCSISAFIRAGLKDKIRCPVTFVQRNLMKARSLHPFTHFYIFPGCYNFFLRMLWLAADSGSAKVVMAVLPKKSYIPPFMKGSKDFRLNGSVKMVGGSSHQAFAIHFRSDQSMKKLIMANVPRPPQNDDDDMGDYSSLVNAVIEDGTVADKVHSDFMATKLSRSIADVVGDRERLGKNPPNFQKDSGCKFLDHSHKTGRKSTKSSPKSSVKSRYLKKLQASEADIGISITHLEARIISRVRRVVVLGKAARNLDAIVSQAKVVIDKAAREAGGENDNDEGATVAEDEDEDDVDGAADDIGDEDDRICQLLQGFDRRPSKEGSLILAKQLCAKLFFKSASGPEPSSNDMDIPTEPTKGADVDEQAKGQQVDVSDSDDEIDDDDDAKDCDDHERRKTRSKKSCIKRRNSDRACRKPAKACAEAMFSDNDLGSSSNEVKMASAKAANVDDRAHGPEHDDHDDKDDNDNEGKTPRTNPGRSTAVEGSGGSDDRGCGGDKDDDGKVDEAPRKRQKSQVP
jgi:hypothetical protein